MALFSMTHKLYKLISIAALIFIASVQQSFADENDDGDIRTTRIVRSTIISSFNADTITLDEALRGLQKKCDLIAKSVGYKPLKFTCEDSLRDEKIVFKTGKLTLRTILIVISEQVGGQVDYEEGEVIITRGVWDNIR